MKKIINRNNKGQILVIFVMMLVGLMAMLALVLDGGNLLTQRRQMQLAADAGALAGARHLCGDEPNQFAASGAAYDYAVNKNQAQNADVSFPGTATIQVTASTEFVPFFLHLIGINDLSAAATAAARCAEPNYGSVMPIGWNCPPPEPEGDDDDPPEPDVCDFQLWEGEGPPTPLTDYLYVFMDSVSEEFDCIYPPNTEPFNPDSGWQDGTYDCDWDDDGENDVFDDSDRGWLDIDGAPNDGAATIKQKIIAACIGEGGEYIKSHTWVGGKPGGDASNFKDVQDYCLNKEVIIPVFDQTCPQTNDPENDCVFDPEHLEDEYVIRQGSSYYYHIVAFASFHITCVHTGGSDAGDEFIFKGEKGSVCPGRNEAHRAAGSGLFAIGTPLTIEGYLTDAISSDVGGGGGYDSGTYVIYLVE